MMMNNTLKDIDPISEALSHAGESSAVSPTLARMFQRELTPDMQLPPMELKTFVMSIIMLMGVIDRILQFERDGKEPLKVLWFDTEQSKQSTLDIIQNRIVEMYHRKVDPDTPFPNGCLRTFNVRFDNCEMRRQGFLELVPFIKPDLVILDGIRDLVSDINDGAEAQRIMEEMLALAQDNDCCGDSGINVPAVTE